MYTALKHSHLLLAVLTVLVAVFFTAGAWKLVPSAKSKLWYVLTRIFGGLAAVTGLAVTFVGPWQQMMYPYIGLIVFALHGTFCGFAKRQLTAANPTTRRVLLAAQLLALLITTALMRAKAF